MGYPWSASRIGCFATCPLKYKLNYVEKWKSSAPVNTQLADKGSAFHETAEKFHTGMEKEEFQKILNENIEKYHVNVTDPEKEFYYDYGPATEKFLLFWKEFVEPKEKEGYKVEQETQVKGNISGEDFIGYLDLCLDNGDNVIVIDYKSGKSVVASTYKDQQLLYAYLKGKEKGWEIPEIAQKIKCYIFAPMLEDLKTKTIEQNMLRGIKEIVYTEGDLKDVIENYYIKNIEDIHTMNWARAKANIAFSCKWCQYLGSVPNDKGFSGCPKTHAQGFMTPEGVTFSSKTMGKIE